MSSRVNALFFQKNDTNYSLITWDMNFCAVPVIAKITFLP